jgi:hypothetical protein
MGFVRSGNMKEWFKTRIVQVSVIGAVAAFASVSEAIAQTDSGASSTPEEAFFNNPGPQELMDSLAMTQANTVARQNREKQAAVDYTAMKISQLIAKG